MNYAPLKSGGFSGFARLPWGVRLDAFWSYVWRGVVGTATEPRFTGGSSYMSFLVVVRFCGWRVSGM